MMEHQAQGHEIIFLTGRHEGLVNSTVGWIYSNTPFQVELGKNLFMRGLNDRRKDTIVKKEIFVNLIQPHYEIILAVDDKKSIIEMWQSFGIKTIHCGPNFCLLKK